MAVIRATGLRRRADETPSSLRFACSHRRSRGKIPRMRRAALFFAMTISCIGEGPSSRAAPSSTEQPIMPIAVLRDVFEDKFERDVIGPDYTVTGAGWTIRGGKLCVEDARNHPLWLLRRLPENARVEFDGVALSSDGDIKVEVWGDGRSHATGASYSDATSYLFVFGGWKNSRHVLARLDEHDDRRLEIPVDPRGEDERTHPVVPQQSYHFVIERRGGNTISWWIDDVGFFEYLDKAPLRGPGHEHFAFNNWSAPACFDNLKITPL